MVPDARGNLLNQIQQGAKLKHVDPSTRQAPVLDERSDLLKQIREGKQLRKVKVRLNVIKEECRFEVLFLCSRQGERGGGEQDPEEKHEQRGGRPGLGHGREVRQGAGEDRRNAVTHEFHVNPCFIMQGSDSSSEEDDDGDDDEWLDDNDFSD